MTVGCITEYLALNGMQSPHGDTLAAALGWWFNGVGGPLLFVVAF
jgi:hypothetical protein